MARLKCGPDQAASLGSDQFQSGLLILGSDRFQSGLVLVSCWSDGWAEVWPEQAARFELRSVSKWVARLGLGSVSK